jgi:hypothetical protein
LQLDLRSWNLLVLATLDESVPKAAGTLLLDHISIFSSVYGAVILPRPVSNTSLASDIKHAYISIRCWLLLLERLVLHDTTEEDEDYSKMALRIWSELWPPLEALASHVTKFNDGSAMLRSVSDHSLSKLLTDDLFRRYC